MSIEIFKDWEPQKFNKHFDDYINEIKKKNEKEDEKLKEQNEIITDKNLFDYTIKEFLYEWKYSIINFVNNILHLNFNKEVFDNNTLFFIGFTILFCIILYLFLLFIIKSIIEDNNNKYTIPYNEIKKMTIEY